MKRSVLLLVAGAASTTVAALATLPSATAGQMPIERAKIAAGEVVFQTQCRACHSPDPAENTFGPTLAGVIDRPAGDLPRFAYSDAMRESGVVWTADNLRLWMADNEGFMPGTRMRHVSITDPAAQDFLLAYIGSLGR